MCTILWNRLKNQCAVSFFSEIMPRLRLRIKCDQQLYFWGLKGKSWLCDIFWRRLAPNAVSVRLCCPKKSSFFIRLCSWYGSFRRARLWSTLVKLGVRKHWDQLFLISINKPNWSTGALQCTMENTYAVYCSRGKNKVLANSFFNNLTARRLFMPGLWLNTYIVLENDFPTNLLIHRTKIKNLFLIATIDYNQM